ncbi:TetR/AcrR family transcriptional regulator [Streptomyces sp. NPDC057020]|uniref:TetR/AcrR family transcriptional regulator n=1 Tax=unclassified Streptomyces TaxID=2593676 RepID=UPI00093C35B5|nr:MULTISPECIES: TetR family transcriptional regulator [unclassified Streptomyces]MCD2467070.1 TetR family transcriptional regulator [Streptomyces sp. MBT42]OKJ50349.1 transcriptional regulator [Streptomyces sp. CB02009]
MTLPGLRERKKQRTREALIKVALELFTAHGYERTTVDEIVDTVEVSQRTFFRYFSSKEEVAFAVQQMVEERFVEALRRRPADEGPFDALRNAVLSGWDTIGDAITEVVPLELYLRTFQMIESTPALLAVHLRRSMEMEETLAGIIAERESLDVDADPRPRIAVAAFSGVMRVTGQMWGRGTDQSLEAIRALTERYLDHLAPALAPRWRDGA